jgi:hypothetical protein
VFTLSSYLPGNIPDGRIEEEDGIDECLYDIKQVIVSFNMCQLMGYDRRYLFRGQAGTKTEWNKNDRFKKTVGEGRFDKG